MNPLIIAAIAAAGALAAVTSAPTSAQTSNVTIYGIMDAGLVRESGGAAGTLTKLTSGVAAASRLGLRGVEDLGGGNAAIFTLESGLKIDSGETDVANTVQPPGLRGLENRLRQADIRSPVHAAVLGRDPGG